MKWVFKVDATSSSRFGRALSPLSADGKTGGKGLPSLPFIVLFSILFLTACGKAPEKKSGDMRIVALAPSVAEVLCGLGLENQVVGVSRYSVYPPEIKEKPAIGGLYDPNWEMIVALRPDIVIGLSFQSEIAAPLKQLGIPFLSVTHEKIDEILDSIPAIGRAVHATAAAEKLYGELKHEYEALKQPATENAPAILVCVARDETFGRMYVAGKDTFYDDIIRAAGGRNAGAIQSPARYPEISADGLEVLNPDLIVDILSDMGSASLHKWKTRTVTMTNEYAWTPGPRFVLLLRDLTEAIRECNSN
ncbi:MAG: helical backbone metal receptor [Kiritimatiellales bacterium]